MRKRIFMLMALALMVVAAMALSGVAQAASPKAKCQQEAESLGLDLTGYTFVYGNNKNNGFTDTAGQPEVFCGLGGDDFFIDTLEAGDIFIGGAGNDSATFNFTGGTFDGGAGADIVSVSNYGTFNGGAGNDSVYYNQGTFNGGDGIDTVDIGFPPVDGPSGS